MKRNKSVLLSLVCVLMLVVGMFTGCGAASSDSDSKDSKKEEKETKEYCGTWDLECDLTDMLMKEMALDEPIDAELVMNFVMELNEDGTYKFYVDEDSLQESLDAFYVAIIDYAAEMIYTEAENNGMTREQADEAIASSEGYATVREYTEASLSFLKDEMSASAILEDQDMSASGVYKVKKGKIFLADDKDELKDVEGMEFSVDGDTLTIEIPEDSDDETFNEDMVELFGDKLEFKRK